jgi:DNA-directed RNA polymerase subunit RPC12/RpoP
VGGRRLEARCETCGGRVLFWVESEVEMLVGHEGVTRRYVFGQPAGPVTLRRTMEVGLAEVMKETRCMEFAVGVGDGTHSE